jgi:TolA-binding protein
MLRGNLLRERGHCARAIEEYQEVRQSAELEDALYYTADCRRRLGDQDAAAAELREYLLRFPAGSHANEAREALGLDR